MPFFLLLELQKTEHIGSWNAENNVTRFEMKAIECGNGQLRDIDIEIISLIVIVRDKIAMAYEAVALLRHNVSPFFTGPVAGFCGACELKVGLIGIDSVAHVHIRDVAR